MLFVSSCLSGDNLPEEHCKYTKHSIFSSCAFHTLLTRFSHITRTHYVLQRICFSRECLAPYASLPCVRKVLSYAAHFIEEAVNVWFYRNGEWNNHLCFRGLMCWSCIAWHETLGRCENLTCKSCSIQISWFNEGWSLPTHATLM